MNFSGRDVFSNEEFDHNALFHAPRYLLFAHHSSNSQTGLNRFSPEQEGGWRLWLHSLKVTQLLRSAACLHTNQSRSYLNHLVHSETANMKFRFHVTRSETKSSTVSRVKKKSSVHRFCTVTASTPVLLLSYSISLFTQQIAKGESTAFSLYDSFKSYTDTFCISK